MTDTEKMRIGIKDSDQLSQFIKDVIVMPMEHKITGNVTIHFLEGEIRAVEINQHTRVLSQITFFKEVK